MRRFRRTAALIALTGVLALTACGQPPWAVVVTPSPLDSPSAAPSTEPTEIVPSEAPQPVPNDLSSGATERQFDAGSITASLTYWSTLLMDKWTHDALKPVTLSLKTSVTPSSKLKVYLQSARMTAVPANATQTFPALAPQIDRATTEPGYLVSPPYSYSQTFNVGTVPAEATFVTLQFQYDFLIQTTPTSEEYQKQSGTDTLTVAIVPNPTAG